MKTVYLALPYSHEDERVRESRFIAANMAAAKLYESGYNVFSPISHSHPISIFMDNSNDSSFWTSVDEFWQSRCDYLFILALPGWDESIGIKKEINTADKNGQKIFFIDPGTGEVSDEV